MAEAIPAKLREFFSEAGIIVAAVEHRVKAEESLAGKLRLKGGKYRDIYDITDLVGIRVITFYIDDVDKVASVLERLFDIDWETFTDAAIQALSQQRSGLVFLLWGSYAIAKRTLIDQTRHLVLTAPHPSPLSAYRGFFGCRHFSRANDYLQQQGQEPIDWTRIA